MSIQSFYDIQDVGEIIKDVVKKKSKSITVFPESYFIDKKKRILIVDDELFNQISAKIVLKAAGMQNIDDICDTANNGKEAVNTIMADVIKNQNCSYSLILMDLNMPVMDGCTATKSIREYLYDNEIN